MKAAGLEHISRTDGFVEEAGTFRLLCGLTR
jgi:hypothetical protein